MSLSFPKKLFSVHQTLLRILSKHFFEMADLNSPEEEEFFLPLRFAQSRLSLTHPGNKESADGIELHR